MKWWASVESSQTGFEDFEEIEYVLFKWREKGSTYGIQSKQCIFLKGETDELRLHQQLQLNFKQLWFPLNKVRTQIMFWRSLLYIIILILLDL